MSGERSSSARHGIREQDFEFFCREILTADFWTNIWEKKHHVFKNVPDNFLPAHFNTDRVASTVLTEAEDTVRCYRVLSSTATVSGAATTTNQQVDQDPIRAYLANASIVQNRFDRKDEVLLEFCQFLGKEFFGHVFAVGYLTPGGGHQAVRAHSDDQDVFVMQLWGRKVGFVFKKMNRVPQFRYS